MQNQQQSQPGRESAVATLGGGCFWCLEAVYDQLEGVIEVVSGYAGGTAPSPSYRQVCAGTTGHAEVVQITFDPQIVSYREILEVFFDIHDPTTPNRQGADVGTQYRSIILYHDEGQKHAAEQLIEELNHAGHWPNPVVTEVKPFEVFYPAEDYHQEYFAQHPNQPYCRAVISPKVKKFAKLYLTRLKPT